MPGKGGEQVWATSCHAVWCGKVREVQGSRPQQTRIVRVQSTDKKIKICHLQLPHEGVVRDQAINVRLPLCQAAVQRAGGRGTSRHQCKPDVLTNSTRGASIPSALCGLHPSSKLMGHLKPASHAAKPSVSSGSSQ